MEPSAVALPPGFSRVGESKQSEQSSNLPPGFSRVSQQLPTETPHSSSEDVEDVEDVEKPWYEIFKPKPFGDPEKPWHENFKPKERTSEDISNMSIQERMQYAQGLKTYGEVLASDEFVKGSLSGVSLGLSENIPGLKQDENRFGVYGMLGEGLGSALPLFPAARFISSSASKIAQKSPYLKKWLEPFLDIVGSGVLGGVYHGATETLKGNKVEVEDILTHGALWSTLHAGLVAIGGLRAAGKALYEIATATGVAEKDIIAEAAEVIQHFNIDPNDKEQLATMFDELVKKSAEKGVTPKQFYAEMDGPKGFMQDVDGVPTKFFPVKFSETVAGSREEALGQIKLDSFETPEFFPREPNVAERALQQELPPAENLQGRVTPPAKQENIPVAESIIHQHPVTPRSLKTRYLEPQDTLITQMTKDVAALSEPVQPYVRQFADETVNLENTFLNKRVSQSGPLASSKRELGGRVKADINQNIKKTKEQYTPLYVEAEEKANQIYSSSETTGRVGGELLHKIEPPSTRPKEYNETIKATETALEDAGFKVERDKAGTITDIFAEDTPPVSKLMELGRRLGEIIDFETVVPSVKDLLKKLKNAVKEDIRIGLRNDPDALAAWDLAEEAHAKLAEKYDTPSIWKIRETPEGERIAALVEQPSVFRDLKDILTPQQILAVERELLEELSAANEPQAKAMLREFKSMLSRDNAHLAQDIVNAKNVNSINARTSNAHNVILEDLSEAFTTGERPETVLKLWQTPKGQRLVEDAMYKSPNWPQVKEYLSKQSLGDMAASIIDKETGKLSVKKLNNFLEKQGVISNIRMLGGDEAANFFSNLEGKLIKFQENARILERMPNNASVKKGEALLEKTKFKNKARKEELKKKFEDLKEIGKSTEAKAKYGEDRIRKASDRNKEALDKAEAHKKLQEKNERKRFERLQEIGRSTKEKAPYGQHKLDRIKEQNRKRNELIKEEIREAKAKAKQEFEDLKEIGKSNQRKSAYGEDRIKRTKEKNKTEQERVAKEKAEAAEASKPAYKKVGEFLKDALGFSPKAALSVFTFMKLGVPQAGAVVIGYNMFEKLATNPAFRKAFSQACKKNMDPTAFFISLEAMIDTLED